MKKLKERWGIKSTWQVIVILFVFSVTGSTSLYVTKPLLDVIGLVKENFEHHLGWIIFYYCIRLILILIIYQFLLLFFGWLFGQFNFFWGIVKKMLIRIGFKSLKTE